jgi:DNA helicase-2/ATP-dependent DNA helicase PcrA
MSTKIRIILNILIVRALSDKFQNICVVGDDAQSIYAFRGANINNILNFQKDYEGVKTFRLEQNYRSTKNIVEAANTVIDKNKTKLDKIVWTANDLGPKIKVHRSMTDAEEGLVAGTIFEQKMQNQMNNGDFAILYRTNAQSRSMEDALRKRDIPTAFMVDLPEERNKRCVLFTISYQSKG